MIRTVEVRARDRHAVDLADGVAGHHARADVRLLDEPHDGGRVVAQALGRQQRHADGGHVEGQTELADLRNKG